MEFLCVESQGVVLCMGNGRADPLHIHVARCCGVTGAGGWSSNGATCCWTAPHCTQQDGEGQTEQLLLHLLDLASDYLIQRLTDFIAVWEGFVVKQE